MTADLLLARGQQRAADLDAALAGFASAEALLANLEAQVAAGPPAVSWFDARWAAFHADMQQSQRDAATKHHRGLDQWDAHAMRAAAVVASCLVPGPASAVAAAAVAGMAAAVQPRSAPPRPAGVVEFEAQHALLVARLTDGERRQARAAFLAGDVKAYDRVYAEAGRKRLPR